MPKIQIFRRSGGTHSIPTAFCIVGMLEDGAMSCMPDQLASKILESAVEFAIISLDQQGKTTSWNPGAEKLLGWRADEMIGIEADAIFTSEDREADVPAQEMDRARSDGRSLNERWHVRKDGTRFWGSGLMMPLLDDEKAFAGYLKIMRDRSEERATEQRYNALTGAFPGFLFVTDASGHLTETNAIFRMFTGRDDAELNGDRWLEAVHDDDRDQAAELWREAVAKGAAYEGRFRVRDERGSYRCFTCRATPELNDQGQVTRWMGTCLDVDNEARARAALERLNLALEHKVTQGTEDLATAIDSLQIEIGERVKAEEALRQAQKMEAVGQLTGGVAHDFNNLLTVIRGSADLLKKPDLSEDRRRRYLTAIVDTAERASALTAQLLAFARRQPLKPEVFDAVARLEALEPLLHTSLGPQIAYRLEVECQPCLILADPNQFDTAVLNLAVNARDAMDRTGTLTIRIGETNEVPAIRAHGPRLGKFVTVSVADSGPGISEDHVARVFEPFYTTKSVGKGTGLGLSQVHGFSKQSGGDIGLASGTDGGAVFTLYLPSADEGWAGARARAASRAQPVSFGHGCILVVEDNEMVGQFATDLLESLGYSALWARDAAAALDLLDEKGERIDAMFSDIVMPGMSGLDLARKARELFPALPILLTSGYSHILAQEGSHGFELLRKPYSADQLSRVLSRLLG